MNGELKQTMENFINSGLKISELWTEGLDENYPFEKSFDEVMDNLLTWKETFIHNTTWELCPYCSAEVLLKNEFEMQICPECKEKIAPCSICEGMDCANCPLK